MKREIQIWLLFIVGIAFAGCCQQHDYVMNNWKIKIDSKKGRIDLSDVQLGPVINNLRLFSGEKSRKCTNNWTLEQKDTILKITVKAPGMVWILTFSRDSIDFTSSDERAFIRGEAPAPERRIPARIARQDNGVIYTQMGFVSAANIHNLFDMDRDIMIRFPDVSSLQRNVGNKKLMDISTPVVSGSEVVLVPHYYDDVVGISKYSAISNNSYNNVTITPESVQDIERDSTKLFIPHYVPVTTRFKTAPTGWSSWYCYYMYPSEENLFAETKAIAQKLKPYGLKYVQLDAAYTRGSNANWLNWNKELYPSGGKAWFRFVRENGLVPGLWMNVFGANYVHPSMAGRYPEDFFLKEDGKYIPACCSADSTVVCLDYTNPAVFKRHLLPLMDTLVNDWGLGYLKAGGGGKWMDRYEKNRGEAYNSHLNSRDVYRKVLSTLREIMGEDRYLLGCSLHEVGVGFGYFDGSRSGLDDYANWDGENHASTGMQAFFNTVFTNAYLNGIVWWTDPDDVMIRDPLTLEEGKTIVSTLSLSGQAYIISDYIADFTAERRKRFLNSGYDINWAGNYSELVKPLPEEKLELYKKTLPTMPIKAMDLFPYQTDPKFFQLAKHFPRALDLKVSAVTGVYDVVAVYNWADNDTLKMLDLYDDLGLERNSAYVVFDFWEHRIIPVQGKDIKQRIPGHGTKTMVIRPKRDHPFLLATSRHITSAYSIEAYSWNSSENIMSGKSKVVPGDAYSIYVYVPEEYGTKDIKIKTEAEVSLKRPEPDLISLTFNSRDEVFTWEVHFL